MDEGSNAPAPKDLSSLSVRELKAIATQVVNPSLVNLRPALLPLSISGLHFSHFGVSYC